MKAFGFIARAALSSWMIMATVPAFAGAPAIVEQVKSSREGETFTAELQMKGEVTAPEVTVQFNNESVQVDFPETALAKGKQLIRVEDRLIKNIYIHQADASTVRAKITLRPGFLAKSLDERIRVRRKSGAIAIEVMGDALKGLVAKNDPEVMRSLMVLDEAAADDGTGLPGKLVAGGDRAPAVLPAAEAGAIGAVAGADAPSADVPAAQADVKKLDTSKLSEGEIPVLTTPQDTKKAEGGQFYRVIITLGVLVILFGAVSFGLKKWSNRSGNKAQNTKIKVLTQHHLGPKKSLAIVHVAGEAILIGVTDHNISMLKTLSLIDDEIPEEVPQNFAGAMVDFDEEESEEPRKKSKGRRSRDTQEDFAMRGLSEIRDVVSSRLRGMKNLDE